MIPTSYQDLTHSVPNYRPGRQGYTIVGIVEHIMDGTLAGTDAWFQNPASQVSAHFGVGKGGELHKYVNCQNTAWHAGVVYRPSAPLISEYPGVNPNLYLIGIEHEGKSGDALTEPQYQTTLWLHRVLIEVYRISDLIGHHEINADHAGCPGPGFPWARLLADLARR